MAKKQPALPGLEERGIAEIEDAAAQLYDVQQERIALQKREAELRSGLDQILEKHGKTRYAYKDLVAGVETSKKAYVRKAKGETDEDAEAEANIRNTSELVEEMQTAAETQPVETDNAANVASFFGKSNGASDAPAEVIEDDLIPDGPKDRALWIALHLRPESAKSWALRKREYPHGQTDEQLTQAIRLEFGIDKKSSHQKDALAFSVDGGKIPKFFYGPPKAKQKATLEGARLVAETRRVLNLPKPGKAPTVTKSKQPQPSHAPATAKTKGGAK